MSEPLYHIWARLIRETPDRSTAETPFAWIRMGLEPRPEPEARALAGCIAAQGSSVVVLPTDMVPDPARSWLVP